MSSLAENSLSGSSVENGSKKEIGGDRKGERGCSRIVTEGRRSRHLLLLPVFGGVWLPKDVPTLSDPSACVLAVAC